MQISLGPVLDGLAPPMPDLAHGPTLLDGCKARFCATPPAASRILLRALRKHVRWRVKTLFKPLQPGDVMTVEEWLDSCPYPLHRKQELLRAWYDANCTVTKKDYKVLSHGKRETYLKYKHARGINSRSDVFKCYTGPFFKAIEEIVYQRPEFIKHIPVRERPAYIMEMLGNKPGPFYETDYSQFEKHFLAEIMQSIEFELYEHMLQHFPQVMKHIRAAMLGKNRCSFGKFRIDIEARRMSGEMCTSLGNGFTNWMLADFLCVSKGGEFIGVVEGDDALFFSPVPLTTREFRELGFEIKILVHYNLLRTSFCGLVMSEDLITMTDPRKVLLNFGWTHSLMMNGGPKVKAGLLRAKALSLAYEHPQCPILSALAETFLVHTSGHRAIFENNWYEQSLIHEVQQFSEETARLHKIGPTDQARSDFADIFEIPIFVQLEVEREIRSWSGGYLGGSWTNSLFGPEFSDCRDYFDRFTSDSPVFPMVL